jgi:hypothetical protein
MSVYDVQSSVSRVVDISKTLAACTSELIKSKGFQDTFNEDIRKALELLKKKEEELRKQLEALEEFRGKGPTQDYLGSGTKRMREEYSELREILGED